MPIANRQAAPFSIDSPPAKFAPFHTLFETAFEINPGGTASETRSGINGGAEQPNWVTGFSFLPDPCHIPEILEHCTGRPPAYDGSAFPARESTKCVDDQPDYVEFYPSWAKVAERCTLQSRLSTDFVSRLRRHLDLVAPIAYEQEFFTGLNSPEDPDNPGTPINQSLQYDAVNLTAGALSTGDAMAQAVQYLATSGVGELGMIHAPPAIVSKWCATEQVWVDDDKRLRHCARGDYIVSGGGYSGQGPIGDPNETPPDGQYWVYTTGIVYKLVGNDLVVDDLEGMNDNGNVQTSSPDINDYSALIERPFAFVHDGCKPTGAILVDACTGGF